MASNPIVRYVADALRFYMEFHARYDGFYGAFIHDPLALAAALDRSLVETEPLYVDVETGGELTAGDDRRRPAPAHRQGRRTSMSRSRPTSPTFLRPVHRTGRRAGGGPRPNVAR